MNAITEYMLHIPSRGSSQLSPPPWLITHPAEPQTWPDPDEKTYVGVTLPLSERDYLVPDAVVILSTVQLLARVEDINVRYPITDPNTGSPYTPTALAAAVHAWVIEAGA